MKVYRDVRLADPFLRPYWRHERVVRMLSTVPPARCKRYDDIWIQEYKKFLFAWRRGEEHRERLLYENPGLYYAHSLHDRMHIEPEMTLMIEARLLAGCTIESIANDCKTMPETVEWYEKLFFNVADFLPHHDWIVRNILLPASDRFVDHAQSHNDALAVAKPASEIVRPHLDMTLKFFAYFGGPLVCDIMISGFRRGKQVRNPDELADYFNEQFASQLQRRSAQAAGQFEVNKYNVMELFATHTRIIEIQRSGKNQENRHNDFEKNVNAMLSELPWSVGQVGQKMYVGSLIGKYDDSPVELDSEEIIVTGSGKEPESAKEVIGVNVFRRRELERNAKSQ